MCSKLTGVPSCRGGGELDGTTSYNRALPVSQLDTNVKCVESVNNGNRSMTLCSNVDKRIRFLVHTLFIMYGRIVSNNI